MKLKDNKGINMITLSIAVILMIIITSVLVYNAKDGTKVKSLNNLYNDIEQLNNKVSSYYLEHGDIPKGVEYTNTGFIDNLENTDPQKNPNNAGSYYVINLSALEGVSLNYGRDYSQSSSAENVNTLEDLYIINEVSHTIYYPRGIRIENKTYYTEPNNWTNVDLSVIPIYTAEQMSWVGDGQAHDVNGISYTFSLDGTYLLKNDIDLSSVCYKVDGTPENDVSWTPIGAANIPFEGNFYGNGHEIKNLYINNSKNGAFVGLFSYIGNCKIKDLSVTGNITSSVTYRGAGIVGTVNTSKTSNIINCINRCNVLSPDYNNNVGGLVSSVRGTLYITDCHNEGNISGSNNAGGIIGYIGKIVFMQNCYNLGNITNSLGDFTGGLIGRDNDSTNNTTITNSYNNGIITGKTHVGGIIGKAYGTVEIRACYNDGEISNTGNNGTGGIVGSQNEDGSLTITNCENQQKITGNRNIGGIVGYLNSGTIEKCKNTGQIEGLAVNSTAGAVAGISGYGAGIISECENYGKIIAKSNCIGGICGQNTAGATISKCFNVGDIISSGDSGTGGITGYQNNAQSITNNCFNIGSVTGVRNTGGILGSNNVGKISNCYNIGNINGTINIYSIIGGGGNGTDVTNCYYLSTLSTIDNNATPKTEIEMKQQAFVDLLNASQEDAPWQQDTANLNKEFPILKWQTEE